MSKYICIHGHFYQPPRENPWLEEIEYQPSASPYHDWNERINAECYAPNTASRILDGDGKIVEIVNNYAKMSFNFGPTLLSWMEVHDPKAYQAILDADKESQKNFSGHGSAIAQVHSHSIMPLNNARDKETQVIWGIKDFEHRFQRKPEGIWLAETAVDTATLEVLVDHGIKYTLLAPRQAKAIRNIGSNDWQQLPHDSVDPRQAYRCNLPSGRSIDLFFYDGRVAQDVAFKGLLNSGKTFAKRLAGTLDSGSQPQLAHIATDGESYGHHHRYGEMALADCLHTIESEGLAKLTNYGEYLELHPPTVEVQIYENSSWSCVHGVERWRSDCGCNTGGEGHWNQKWRAPLRNALNWLQDKLIDVFEQEANALLKDPWAARNDFIDVILDRSDAAVKVFLQKHTYQYPKFEEEVKILRLMELQRNAMYMFTSCGWFFSEISGIENTQILKYACRAIYFAKQVSRRDFEQGFINELEKAKSNIPSQKDGAFIYKNNVLPVQVGLKKVGMHYAIASLFEQHPEKLPTFNYIATSEIYDKRTAGRQILATGRTIIRSKITHSRKEFSFAVLYLGQQSVIGAISVELTHEGFDQMRTSMNRAFADGNLSEMFNIMQLFFGSERYSLENLFKDEKIHILNLIMENNFVKAETALRDIYTSNYQLMNTFVRNDLPIRSEFKDAVESVLNYDLVHFFNPEQLRLKELKRIVSEFKKWDIELKRKEEIEHSANQAMLHVLLRLQNDATSIERLKEINEILRLLEEVSIKSEGWEVQNLYFEIFKEQQEANSFNLTEEWTVAFVELGKHLGLKAAFNNAMV